MANPFAAIGNFFSDIGKGAQQVVSDIGGAISEGFSNLTGGGGSNNKPQPAPTPTPTPTPTSSSTSSGGGGSYTPSPSSGGSNNTPSRSNSAGAQALNQQITSQPETPKPTITGTQSEPTTGIPTIISGSNAGESLTPDIITPSKPSPSDSAGAQALNEQINSQSETPKPTITGVQTETVTGIPTILAGSQAGNILPETMITPNKPSTGDSAGALGLGEQISQTLKPTITGTQKEPTVGIPTVLAGSDAGKILGGSMITSSKPEKTSFGGVTSNDINFGLINSGLMTGITSGISNLFGGTDGDTKKPVAKSNDNSVGKGVDTIYRDDDLVGIHYFDNKAESEAFLKELYSDGNFDWGDSDTKWYDPKTGEYIGYLGEEAYPYAIIVPETYDAPVRLEFNTGGQKGGSPVKDTGKSTWADVPSALTRMELRDAGFDYGFSSRNLDTQELMNQSEMRGYDSSWYDGKIGQNIGLYDAEKGGYDARTSNISVADVRAGKVSDDVLSSTPSGQAILDATAQIEKTQPTYYNLSKWQNPNVDWDSNEKLPADRHIDNPTPVTQSGGILNNPVELIGTILGVGALTKVAGIGGKVGGSLVDDWVSAGGKTMSGSNIIDSGVSSMVGGGSVRNVVKPVSEFVSTNNQRKLAEIGGLGIGGIGIFAGKELESPSNVFEIIPQNIFSTEVEPSSTISGLNEITSSPDYQSELEVLKESSNPIEGFKTGSVFEIERVKEKEKEKEKEKTKQKDEGFSYADVPSYTIEDKIRYAQEALKKQLEQEREYEKQKAEEAAKQKEQDRLIEKDSELIFIPTEITKVNEKNKNKVIENHENVIFNYPMKEKTKNKLVHDMVLTRDGLVKNKGLTPFIGGFGDSSSNVFVDGTPFISEVKDITSGISMGIPRPSPKKDDDDDDDYRMGELTGASIFGRGLGRSWKVYNKDISDANQFTGLF